MSAQVPTAAEKRARHARGWTDPLAQTRKRSSVCPARQATVRAASRAHVVIGAVGLVAVLLCSACSKDGCSTKRQSATPNPAISDLPSETKKGDNRQPASGGGGDPTRDFRVCRLAVRDPLALWPGAAPAFSSALGDGELDLVAARDGRFSRFGVKDETKALEGDWFESAEGPSPREGHAMAYDAGRAEVVLFGGWDSKSRVHFDDRRRYTRKTSLWGDTSIRWRTMTPGDRQCFSAGTTTPCLATHGFGMEGVGRR